MFLSALTSLPFLARPGRRAADPAVVSYEDVEALGTELDELRARTVAKLGTEDREYIYKVIKAQRGLEVAGRAAMYAPLLPPVWLAGVGALSLSKILDNMEIGHNVLHGQYDWMREPGLNSQEFEWDIVCPADQWKHSHNYMHHTFTNISGKDRDIGYSLLRMDPSTKWLPHHLLNPVSATLLMVLFEWGVMGHDLEIENVIKGKRKWSDIKSIVQGWGRKAGRQVLKDYVVFPALTGPMFVTTVIGNAGANIARNLWTFSIIFCGHFPTGVQVFTEEETAEETRAQWYVRQMLGSANITGSSLFHVMSGNLSHQIEHHLFPDVPAHRYPDMAPEVEALCAKYGLPYNKGGFFKQISSVWGKIVKFAVPPFLLNTQVEPSVIVERQPAAA